MCCKRVSIANVNMYYVLQVFRIFFFISFPVWNKIDIDVEVVEVF